ncbi:hypothetical protein AAY473_035968 [Plecturocebus cupreus]
MEPGHGAVFFFSQECSVLGTQSAQAVILPLPDVHVDVWAVATAFWRVECKQPEVLQASKQEGAGRLVREAEVDARGPTTSSLATKPPSSFFKCEIMLPALLAASLCGADFGKCSVLPDV